MGSYNRDSTSSNFQDHVFPESNGFDSELHEYSGPSSEDPPWADKVGENGQLFYIEASEPVEYITPHSNPAHTPTPTHFQNGYHDVTKPSRKKRLKNLLGSSKKTEPKLTDKELNRHNLSSSGHGVTFNDIPTGVMKELTIFVDPFKNNYGRRATKCESLFGIIPGHFGAPSHESDGPPSDRRIMVQGLLPGEEASKAGVKIGEWLMCVNDLEVTYDNLDSILMGITGPRFIKLSLQKIAIQTSPKPVLVKKKTVINEDIVKMVSGERLQGDAKSLQGVPHAVMYLTLECQSDTMADKDDIVYAFPRTDSKLVTIRGMFVTLSHMMPDVTNNTAKNSSLVVDGTLVHAGYCKHNREVLLLCLPAHKVSLVHMNQLLENVVRLLKLLFGSIHSAFSKEKNHSQLDHFFTLLFQKLLLAEAFYETAVTSHIALEPFYDALPAVRALTLPVDSKMTVNNCLSELEAADFADMSEVYYDMRRMYSIVGSCVFYKGYLLASHVHGEDLQDVCLYLRYHCLLTLCNQSQLGQVVLWREVFPTRRCHRQVDPTIPGYTEPPARFFLLVVGMKNMLLGVLLEAGGCASWAEGVPGPDPFYVDQAKATLLQMESLDVISHCESRLQSIPVPSLSTADDFLPSHKSKSKDSTDQLNRSQVQNSPMSQMKMPRKTPSKEPESILKKKNTPLQASDGRQKGRGAVYDVDSDVDSQSTGGTSDGSTPIMNRLWSSSQASEDSLGSGSGSSALFKGSKRRRNLLSAYDMSGVRKGLEEGEESPSLVKVTSGCDNTLFHYVTMDTVDGIFVCPCQQEVPVGSLHNQVLHNFHQACIAIRKVFQQSRRNKDWSRKGEVGKFGIDDSLGHVTEQGVLFQCQPTAWAEGKKAPPVMTYWVVGRIFSQPVEREFYVCFHDSAQQNTIEMAFKLGYGLAL